MIQLEKMVQASHSKKIGTPTMGGLLILLGVFLSFTLGSLTNPYNWFLIFIAGSFGLLVLMMITKKLNLKIHQEYHQF